MPDKPTNDLIVHNGTVLTLNPAFDVIADAVVVIRDGRIARVCSKHVLEAWPVAGKTLDARGGIILPG
ncbi:MAG: hypothetical protein JRI36_08570, partial [Deltaproteobacteria bacterium]|nr:hypothetical protein [Deltaproteobacteria bacterium]